MACKRGTSRKIPNRHGRKVSQIKSRQARRRTKQNNHK